MPRPAPPTHNCHACNQPMPRKPNESSSNYRKRKTCNPTCKRVLHIATKRNITIHQARTELNTTRTCHHCHKPYPKPKRITFTEYQKQRYCSRACARAAHPGPHPTHNLTPRTRPARPIITPPPNLPRSTPTTLRNALRAALQQHPDLAHALATLHKPHVTTAVFTDTVNRG